VNVGDADVHEAADLIRVGDAERYRRLLGCRPAPDVDDKPHIRDLDVSWQAVAVAFAQNAAAEDPFVEASRSVDVDDGEKERDGKPILRRHLIAFLLDLYLAHERLQFGCGISPLASVREWRASAMKLD
jgi:hypothetical protein